LTIIFFDSGLQNSVIIQLETRGSMSQIAHPRGYKDNVKQKQHFRKSRKIPNAPTNVLVIAASADLILASRVARAFGGGANLIEMFFDSSSEKDRPVCARQSNSVLIKSLQSRRNCEQKM
jgi:enoyl-[acyl-carrier protein] reductase/trans-2-enoyl-CoA reductase (NAD+)